MREILVAYPSKDTALKLRSLLEGEGYDVQNVCETNKVSIDAFIKDIKLS